MIKKLQSASAILFFLLFSCCFLNAQSKDERDIRLLMQDQENAWNNGDLETFMQGYWKNDSLMFIGKSGITYGWQKTLDNYKKGYPNRDSMGKLTFTLVQLKPLGKENYFIVGKWFLKRNTNDLGGYFTLWFRKMKGQWYIVADHSS